MSNLGKLFTTILNLRLLKWSYSNDILTDAQFGFRSGYSTIDAIFCVYSVIQNTFCKGKRLYCCFVDYLKAFDSVNRLCLWYKIAKLGVRGKLLNVLKSMYTSVKACIRFNGFNSEYFSNNLGVMQGEVLSPILFSFYVNDFEQEFINNGDTPVEFQDITLFLLMYADDMILMSESIDGLQNMLNTLSNYAKKWGLSVNIKKTKIVVFRKGGTIRADEKWVFNNKSIYIVYHFCYLGVLLHYN